MKLYLILIVFLFSSCGAYEPGFAIINVVNHTDHSINVLWNIDTVPEYPSVNHTEYFLDNIVSASDSLKAKRTGTNGWERFLAVSKNKKVNFFIFNADTLKAYNSIDDLILKRKYKRYEYSEEELIKSNWRVVIKD